MTLLPESPGKSGIQMKSTIWALRTSFLGDVNRHVGTLGPGSQDA